MKTLIIGEAGSCHDGLLDKALDLVSICKEAGADACKFQFWSSARRLAERRRSGDHYEAVYRQYQMPREWLPILRDACVAADLLFMATAYLEEDIPVVEPYVAHFKVASFEAGDLEFVTAHYAYCRKIEGVKDRWLIVSTGLQSDATLRALMVERDRGLGARGIEMKLLHCVSAYPAPYESLALRQIRTMNFDGFSDHAAVDWPASGPVAVALGAKILEVHVRPATMDEQNPDAPHALLPGQFRRYVQNVRRAEAAIGEESWRSHNPAEDEMRQYKVQP